MNKNTIVIAYPGGTYGTYLEWALTTLTTDIPIQSPLTTEGARQGNSHNFKGHQLMDLDGWNNYVASNNSYPFARLHPKSKKEHSLSENLTAILKDAHRIIYIYPDRDSLLLSMNNNYSKTAKNWFEHNINPTTLLYDNWPIEPGTPLDQVPNWVKREFLSYYFVLQWQDAIEWNHLEEWNHPNCLNITIRQLLYNFENTILKIKEFCNLDFKKNVTELAHIHLKMLTMQKNLNQDWLVREIVHTTVNGINFDWSNYYLPIPSQGVIQWELRNLGYELACHGLDIFPTTSVQLQELLYQP